MRCTLRKYLSFSNQSLTIHKGASCSQARNDEASSRWPIVDRWTTWQDFQFDNINTLFQPLLDTEFDLADPPQPLDSLNILRRERAFEMALARNNAIVNEALRAACLYLGLNKVEWTVDDNGTEGDMYPDWCGWTEKLKYGRNSGNLVPGDTKFTRTFFQKERVETLGRLDSEALPLSSPPSREKNLVQSCLQQACYYAIRYHTRYFYIITNMELFLCRRSLSLPSTSPIAQTRKRRMLNPTPTKTQSIPSSPPVYALARQQSKISVTAAQSAHTSPNTPVSYFLPREKSFTDISLSSVLLYSDSTYMQDDGDEEVEVECISIPWKSSQDLTVNMALFVVHLLALLANDPQISYEPIQDDPDYSVIKGPGQLTRNQNT
jgi:hypothetical protein